MAIKDFFSNLFRTKQRGVLSSQDFGIVSRLFGEQWNDASYLEAYGKSIYVYACVSKIAEKVASIDFQLNKIINSDGESERVYQHPALDLLYRVNPYFTKHEFMEIDIINRKLTGDSFILKVRNNSGQVVELWNIRPDLITIHSSPDEYISHYKITTQGGTQENIAPEDMIHIKYPSPLETHLGLSPLSSAKNRVDIEEYATRYQKDFFFNNARPDAVIETEFNPTPDQRAEIVKGWEKQHRGLGKSSKVGLLWGGAKYNQISLSQREMDFIESMKFTRDDILVAFKVPKPIIAITDSVGRSRAEAETMQDIFLTETVIPEINRFVEKINEQLIEPEFGEEYFISYEDPVPDNREMRLQEWQVGVDKWITRNEVRQTLGLEPIQGGDTLYVPFSSVPLDTERNIEAEENDDYKNLYGKRALRLKYQFREQINKDAKELKEKVKNKLKQKTKKKESLFKDEVLRKKYTDYINKSIDDRAERVRKRVITLKNEQMKEFISKFEKENPETKSEIRKLFNTKEQNKKFRDSVFPLYLSIFKEAGEEAMSLLRIDKPFTLEKADIGKLTFALLDKRARFFAKSVNNTTLLALTKTLAEAINLGEALNKKVNRIKDVYDDFDTYRAERIARTETQAVANEATLEAYRQSEVVKWKEWIATLDDRVRDEHLMMDGEIKRLEEPFSIGYMYPGTEVNCRCVLAPVIHHIE